MKAFNFPLESLRTLRKQREQAAQQRYAKSLLLCEDAQRVLQSAEEELKTGHAALAGELEHGVTASRLVHLQLWCKVLEIRWNECMAAVAEARRDAEDARQLMTAAAREREALDRFHDKSHATWQRALQAEEQKMFDELAVQRQAVVSSDKTRLN